ncbi:hypothetical protein BYT27DRAFT_6733086 [Phlegmacium glaucopus]|nr:hypothetical protein BYT27DRAFT_6733086 [Phlegmacium glaucopus]
MFDTAASLTTPAPVKPSKFKPSFPTSSSSEQSRKAALTPFCTPGFQSVKSTSTSRPKPKYDQVVYVSSDSTSSSPGRSALKRDSSDISIAPDISPPVSKKQRKVPIEEKENLLPVSSKINCSALPAQTTPRPNGKERKYADLSSKSLETLNKLLIYGLHMKNLFADECLQYHSRADTDKDIILLEEIR